MGEYAEMMLDGTCCNVCGEYLGSEGNGFPVTCKSCGVESDEKFENGSDVFCPHCNHVNTDLLVNEELDELESKKISEIDDCRDFTINCQSCHKKFDVFRVVEVNFYTMSEDDEEIA